MSSFRHILVALDLSRSSAHVLAEAAAVAKPCAARLTALHVATPTVGAATREDLRDILADFVLGAPATGTLPIHLDLLEGDPAREILNFAAAHEVDLIVIGLRDHGLVDRLLLESVGDLVTREVRCSVLTIGVERPGRPVASGMLSDVLCAVDLTDTSVDTLDTASDLALAAGARLTLLHVIDPSRWRAPLPVAEEKMDVTRSALAAEAYDHMATLMSRSPTPDLKADTLVSFGLVPNQIVGAASAVGAQLVVVGAHSRRILGHTFLGSTAKEVLRQARRPVLLARPTTRQGCERTSERRSDLVSVY